MCHPSVHLHHTRVCFCPLRLFAKPLSSQWKLSGLTLLLFELLDEERNKRHAKVFQNVHFHFPLFHAHKYFTFFFKMYNVYLLIILTFLHL